MKLSEDIRRDAELHVPGSLHHEMKLEWADRAAKLEAVGTAAPESAELLRKFLGFGPSTKLELALAALEERDGN